VPCLYLIVEDFLQQKNATQMWLKGQPVEENDERLSASRQA
jgi:hypothetical protein